MGASNGKHNVSNALNVLGSGRQNGWWAGDKPIKLTDPAKYKPTRGNPLQSNADVQEQGEVAPQLQTVYHSPHDGIMNTAEQRHEDYALLITVKNMLLCVERQYNDFHGELARCQHILSDRSKKMKDKEYENVENKEYESKKMEHLLKRFQMEVKTPNER